jgi:alkanesulfonate monooxygenase SsuD/methylene tetrahydromethanopterin reductase-like flavin-dependent oxidoreductase (luciferase family)
MRFGLFGSAAARRGSGEFDSVEGFRDFIDSNVEAEALGFHGTFVVEHHFTGFGQVSATLNLLTWLGARTTTLRLGTAVIVLPWHNPVLLAEQAATLDLLSGGRLDFGVGKGYRYNEFNGFDVPYEDAGERFEESVALLLKCWTSEERFSHRGKYWSFNDIIVEPPPARKPHPAMWMGAGSPRSIRDVARRGFNLLLGHYATTEEVAECIAVYKAAVEESGRVFDPMMIGIARAIFVAENDQERDEALERRLANRVRQLKVAMHPDGTVHGGPDRTTGDPNEVNLNSAIYGNPEEIARKLEALRQCGAGYILMNGGGSGGGERGRRSLRRFAKEIMPLFPKREPVAKAAE